MFDQIAERRRVGLKLLLLLYDHWQDKNQPRGVNVTLIAPIIGVDPMTAVEIALKFHSQGLLTKTHDDIAIINNRGVQEIEYAVSHPNDETQQFPAVNSIKDWIQATFETPCDGPSGNDSSGAKECGTNETGSGIDIETHASAPTPNENALLVGARIRAFMEAEGYKIKELAGELHVTREALSSAVNGGNRHGKTLLVKLANKMGIEPDELTGTDAA